MKNARGAFVSRLGVIRRSLRGQRHEAIRLKILTPSDVKPIFSDPLELTTNTLSETKGTVERQSMLTPRSDQFFALLSQISGVSS